ncbi:hypothetical protein [Phaeocystidibacter luteus]|uniref:Uncharacterized protein n=1 Tax=Phaeocystidibacter luteus TaxID=911197 RepID=A0A6N6RMR6_9FLAO|nr:hypothetical protein [Phaeocystidibacter luteus]KAB2814864.1 hypothetical protein F8C67_03695 [Phaeocystidibacter luteus]
MRVQRYLNWLVIAIVLPTLSFATPMINFTLANNSEYTFMNVYISDSDSEDWGNDRLGSKLLNPGEEISFLISAGTYDLKIVDEDGDICTQMGLRLSGDVVLNYSNDEWLNCLFPDEGSSTTTSSSSSSSANLTFYNESGWDIRYIYASSTSSDTWGTDHLGSDILETGSSFSFSLPVGEYDFKFIDEDGDECILEDIQISGSQTVSITREEWLDCLFPDESTSAVHQVTLVNNSGWDITYVYASLSSDTNWGSDHLGSNILADGNRLTLTLPAGNYDFKMIDEDGDECIMSSMPVFSNETYYLSEERWLDCLYGE